MEYGCRAQAMLPRITLHNSDSVLWHGKVMHGAYAKLKSMTVRKRRAGFTIVELLIVIVVIAILAAIAVTSYSGINNRANDSAVQSDLKNIAKKLEIYKVDNGVYPAGDTQLAILDIKMSKSSYGNGMLSGTYNVLYCRALADGPNKFALIAGSKSGNVFTYRSDLGTITQTTSWVNVSNSPPNCQAAGVNQVNGDDRDFFYINNIWRPYVG